MWRRQSLRSRMRFDECPFPGCDNPRRTLGLCDGHYRQYHRGKILTPLQVLDHPGEASRRKVLAKYKRDASRRNLSWTLTGTEFDALTASNCIYCAIPPSQVNRESKNGVFVYNGIDRVDNERGYDPDNVVSCCRKCNWAKSTMTAEEFLLWRQRIAANL